jgi:hypothetical protein
VRKLLVVPANAFGSFAGVAAQAGSNAHVIPRGGERANQQARHQAIPGRRRMIGRLQRSIEGYPHWWRLAPARVLATLLLRVKVLNIKLSRLG